MRFRKLGDSEIEVSEVALGSWLTYGAGVEREQTEACTRAAFDAGINFFDTSNIYGVGAAEAARGEEMGFLPAAGQHDLAGARGRADPVLLEPRHLAGRLVAPRTGGADGQVRARRSAARRLARRQRGDELRDLALHGRRGARGG